MQMAVAARTQTLAGLWAPAGNVPSVTSRLHETKHVLFVLVHSVHIASALNIIILGPREHGVLRRPACSAHNFHDIGDRKIGNDSTARQGQCQIAPIIRRYNRLDL